MHPQTRSSYEVRRSIMPQFIRRFLYRNPKFIFYFAVGGTAVLYMIPSLKGYYYYFTLSKEDYENYYERESLKSMNRARFGEGLIIPFFDSTFNLFSREVVEKKKKELEKYEVSHK
ncbi:unnamed protein product [Soboliphyme baturini]|uniref:Small integral membrane protein 8 n=1 Tax=Soboliphyme baturini TaxID=241478 RepID=A0A183IFH1_9BILA|nr:unnamed protein product [Soboliphyme baturini]